MTPHAADHHDPFCWEGTLPETLPESPWELFTAWWTLAHEGLDGSGKVQPNPNAMSLATVDPDGRPSNRIVLCKWYDAETGTIVFHTNYTSPKGRALDASPRVAACMHWDSLSRQVRLGGAVTRCTPEENERYFGTRALDRRVGAWASEQSEPIASRDALLAKFHAARERFGVEVDASGAIPRSARADVPCPPYWGGFRVWVDTVELWIEGTGRFHDRARWNRTMTPSGDGFTAGRWSATRLQP